MCSQRPRVALQYTAAAAVRTLRSSAGRSCNQTALSRAHTSATVSLPLPLTLSVTFSIIISHLLYVPPFHKFHKESAHNCMDYVVYRQPTVKKARSPRASEVITNQCRRPGIFLATAPKLLQFKCHISLYKCLKNVQTTSGYEFSNLPLDRLTMPRTFESGDGH